MTDPIAEAPPATLRDHLAWTLPFVVFMVLLLVSPKLPVGPALEGAIRVALLTLTIWVASRHILDFRVERGVASVMVGVVVFLVWVGPDLLIPGHRGHWLLQNSLTGTVGSSFPEAARDDSLAILFRAMRAIILVPIVEELFWRGWLLRWLIDQNFTRVRLGVVTPFTFIATAILFASEHGPYWDVGLAAGIAYNWWMMRTRSLGDLIVAHAVTNACLVAYVLATGMWEYL